MKRIRQAMRPCLPGQGSIISDCYNTGFTGNFTDLDGTTYYIRRGDVVG